MKLKMMKTKIVPRPTPRQQRIDAERTRRRRVILVTLGLGMIPLAVIGIEAVQALMVEKQIGEFVGAGALGQTSQFPIVYSYEYDNNGNLIREKAKPANGPEQITNYSYDYENHLTQVTSPTGAITAYTNDADGIRNSKTHTPPGGGTPVTTRYVVDKNREHPQVLQEWEQVGSDPAVLKVRYLYGPDDEPISATHYTNGIGRTFYFHYDGQRSIRQVTDESGAVTDTYTYDAFGNLIADASSGNSPNNYRYTGEQFDPSTGTYYLRARYFDPTTGRFMTRDPHQGSPAEPLSQHKYLYANADPVNRRDPSGQFSYSESLSVSRIVSTTITRINQFSNVKEVADIAKQLIQGASVQQVLVTAIGEKLFDRVGGEVFEKAIKGLGKNIGKIVKGQFDAHHPIPIALGGDVDQLLSPLNRTVHRSSFAKALNDALARRGIIHKATGGPGNGIKDWTDFFQREGYGGQAKVLEAISEAANEVDTKFKTNLLEDVWINILGGKFGHANP